MSSPNILSVPEVADRLGVSQQRVRALIANGQLDARRIGRDYAIDPGDAAAFARRSRSRGRPLIARNAWALLALLDGNMRRASAKPRSLSRLRALIGQGSAAIVRALSHAEPRFDEHAWRVLPADLSRLLDDPSLVLSGLAASDVDVGYDHERDGVEAYVSNRRLAELRKRLRPIERSDRPNLFLRVPVEGDWVLKCAVAPAAVAAADLLAHRDPRVRRAGEHALRRLADAAD